MLCVLTSREESSKLLVVLHSYHLVQLFRSKSLPKMTVPQFAYVIYLEDDIREIISIKDIEDFAPKNLEDYNKKKIYKALYRSEGGEDDDEFYSCSILTLAGNYTN